MDEKMVCFPEDEITKPREIIIDIMEHMISRGLTDYSGGNMALRVGQKIYSTQRHSAALYRWKLRPDNIIVTDINKNVLEGRAEKLSRELNLHMGILQRFPEINCTLHGNTFYSPLLVAAGVKPVSATEVADYYKIKEIPVIPEGIEPLSDEENNIVFSHFAELKKRGEALVVIMPVHGIIVGAPDHNEAFALLEAVENNARFILFRDLLKTSALVSSIFERLGKETASPNTSGPATNFQPAAQMAGPMEIKNPVNPVYVLDSSIKILTADDVADIVKKTGAKIIQIKHPCQVTDFAETKALEFGVQILKD